jgi:hypothetical protein
MVDRLEAGEDMGDEAGGLDGGEGPASMDEVGAEPSDL